MFSAFSITVALSPWLGTNIGVQNVARIGAFISIFVAFCLLLIDSYSVDEKQFIKLIQLLAPFFGISDSMLAFSILAAFVNTTPPSERGWNFGLMFVCIAVAFVFGIDHEGILSSLQIMEDTDESSFTLVCFLSLTISIIILLLNTLVNFESAGNGGFTGSFRENVYRPHQWWRSLSVSGVRWACLVVLIFALILGYIYTKFTATLEVNYSWDTSSVTNISLFAVLGFLLACPFVGRFADLVGSLKVMTTGNYALALALLVLAFVADGMEAGDLTVGFVVTCFGICAAPSVVMALISCQDSLEAEFQIVAGSVTASLYLISWMLGILFGLLLECVMTNSSFQEMALECAVVEGVMGIMASFLTALGILEQPIVEPSVKKLVAERKKKTPYVVENDWEVI